MKKIIEKIKKLYNKEEPLKIEWIFAILIGLIILLMFVYIDTKSLTVWSTNILDCIADGKITKYFTYTSLNIYNLPHKYVSGTLYSLMLWSIWNIPIWIAQRFFNTPIVSNCWSLLWSKLFLVTCLGVTLFYTYKLTKYLTNDKKISKWVVFLSFSFVFTYVGVFYAGQNDILICMFGIMALYYLIKKTKNNRLFYLFSGFAISVKYFFFLPYFILILFLEKDILKILKKLFIGILPTLIFQLVCYILPIFEKVSITGDTATNSILRNILVGSFQGVSGIIIPLFVVAILILAFVAYNTIPKDENEKNNYIIYFTTVTFLLLFMFTSQTFYRMILLMPFIFIMFSLNKKKFRMNVILESISSLFFIVIRILNSFYFFAIEKPILEKSIITSFLKVKDVSVSPNIFFQNHFSNNASMIAQISAAIVFACYAIIIYINFPRRKEKNNTPDLKLERYIIWFRLLIIVPIILYLLKGMMI